MFIVILLLGLVAGYLAGWLITSRSYRSLVASIDAQNKTLLNERREHKAEAERLKILLTKADVALRNARRKRDEQAGLIIDLTDRVNRGTASSN